MARSMENMNETSQSRSRGMREGHRASPCRKTPDKTSLIRSSALPYQKGHGTQLTAMAAWLGLEPKVFF
jgi:hypothetical protein